MGYQTGMGFQSGMRFHTRMGFKPGLEFQSWDGIPDTGGVPNKDGGVPERDGRVPVIGWDTRHRLGSRQGVGYWTGMVGYQTGWWSSGQVMGYQMQVGFKPWVDEVPDRVIMGSQAGVG